MSVNESSVPQPGEKFKRPIRLKSTRTAREQTSGEKKFAVGSTSRLTGIGRDDILYEMDIS
jgi:hypothetical protein